jgi:hypothetical protein
MAMAKNLRGTKQIVTLSLDAELMDRVTKLADAKNRSRSALIEELIASGIEQEEVTTAIFTNPVLRQGVIGSIMQPGMLKELAKAVGVAKPGEVARFQQGIQLLNNYSKAYEKAASPEDVAKSTMKRTVAQLRSAKKGKKK